MCPFCPHVCSGARTQQSGPCQKRPRPAPDSGARTPEPLLSRVGATTKQLLSMTGWQAFTLSVTGIGLGIVFGAASVLVITKVLTSSWTPWPGRPAGCQ
jgi:hypothetical protein